MVALAVGTQISTDNGLVTQYGIILPPGAQVAAYVRSTGIQSQDTPFIAQNLVTTLAAGLARVRPNMGDFVVVLPGHVENVADATTFSNALLAGTKIIGVGRGGNTPTFTWSATAASWVVAVNDVMIAGLRLQTAGITGAGGVNTTLPISVTGNDFGFYGNEVETGTGTSNVTTCMNVSGTASRFDITGNIFRSQLASAATTTALVLSGTGTDGRVCDNEIISGAVAATGNVNVTGAVLRLKVLRNTISNTSPASVAAITFANVASTGQCANNTITVLSTGAQVSGTTGITIGAACVVGFFQNFVVNDPITSGKLQPTVDT